MSEQSTWDPFDLAGLDADFEVPKIFRGRGALSAMRTGQWAPIRLVDGKVLVAAVDPGPAVLRAATEALGNDAIRLVPADPGVVRRILENTQDVCPGFPPEASRLDLAKVRTYLAGRRSFLSGFRTTLARGRTGLSMFRTGIAFVTVVMVLFRVFGLGLTLPLEAVLLGAGVFFIIDGIIWYLPARRMSRRGLPQRVPAPDPALGNTGVLAVSANQVWPCFRWLPPVPGAKALRAGWAALSPIARRRFYAMDRTMLALERTTLAELRSIMARSRTGLALGRTGIAVSGVGIALIRQFHHGSWDMASYGLICLGSVMALEGLSWYLPARRVGSQCQAAMCRAEACPSPRTMDEAQSEGGPRVAGPDAGATVAPSAEGVLGTTGLALERTLLAERRNAMARLRTHMARSRTGLSFMRTGFNAVGVGLGLLAWFGTASLGWTVFNLILLVGGLVLIVDGLCWHLPADRARRATTYCTADFELTVPDYAVSEREWGRASAGLGGVDAA
ncbi:hypothetical protein [Desulfovibrio sp. TomC]|uniref:hypothetical protein n=1 Tax=Desulfovibrio sp. TomC TaxID=1562888 RepID=UPI0005B803D9|nr:hypothetical protein [Desulfovibrio sp. TomC]